LGLSCDLYTAQPPRLLDRTEIIRKLSEDVKRMADLLKSGATMLSDVCPECGNPLFRVKGDIFCAKCNKPVVYARATGPHATVSQVQQRHRPFFPNPRVLSSSLFQETISQPYTRPILSGHDASTPSLLV